LTTVLDDHELAAQIAREAGRLLVRRRAEGASKDDGDRESNELILARLAVARPDDAVVLVGHSGAGPLLAQVGFARRAARGVVGGYLFLDAGLPRPGRAASRLDLMTGEDPVLAAELRAALEAGARFPARCTQPRNGP